jgi:ubiquitin carboxyl-terminal hydrolase 7
MSQKVADYLKHESIKLRFTTSNANSTPKSILKRSLNQTISDIMQPATYNTSPSTIIFYERLDVSIVELETKRSLKISWTGIHNKEEVCCSVAAIYS